MNRRCRRGQHNLVSYKTLETARFVLVYKECSRCEVRKADRTWKP